MNGVFDLRSAADLLAKLRRDHQRLLERVDSDNAFNFFVTAEHLIDWLHPDDRTARERLRAEPLLALVSHIANGAKHFGPLNAHHKSVKSTGRWRGGYWPSAYFPPGYFGPSFGGPVVLVVRLDGAAEAKFGPLIRVDELAAWVLAYWEEPGRVPEGGSPG